MCPKLERLESFYPVDAELAKKGWFYERNQHFLRFAYRDVHDPGAPLDAQGGTTGREVWIAKDVPILRIDHVSTKVTLPGVWQAHYSGGVLDFKEMKRRFFQRAFPMRTTEI
jgi:hypothetical protein